MTAFSGQTLEQDAARVNKLVPFAKLYGSALECFE